MWNGKIEIGFSNTFSEKMNRSEWVLFATGRMDVAGGNKKLEAAPGFEPGNKGFAGLCLTTWLCRLKTASLYEYRQCEVKLLLYFGNAVLWSDDVADIISCGTNGRKRRGYGRFWRQRGPLGAFFPTGSGPCGTGAAAHPEIPGLFETAYWGQPQ